MRLSPVRDIIGEYIRSHLLWLEVFGVLLGALFAGALYFVMAPCRCRCEHNLQR